MVSLQLPFPVSVNSMFANRRGPGRGRIISRDYSMWRKEAEAEFLRQRKSAGEPIKGHFCASIIFDESQRRWNSDLDNRIKPVLDLIQKVGLIEDDRYCDKLEVSWGPVSGALVKAFKSLVA
jgi:Holliday junction resolvase RusA-like endonuclease